MSTQEVREGVLLKLYKRVPDRFFGIRDLAYVTAGIQDFLGKGERDSGL